MELEKEGGKRGQERTRREEGMEEKRSAKEVEVERCRVLTSGNRCSVSGEKKHNEVMIVKKREKWMKTQRRGLEEATKEAGLVCVCVCGHRCDTAKISLFIFPPVVETDTQSSQK